MKTWFFLTYTISGTVLVLFAALGAGQLAPGSPVPALVTGLGLLVILGFPLWWRLRDAFSTPDPLRGGRAIASWSEATPVIFARRFALIGAVLGGGLAISVVLFAWFGATDPPAAAFETLLGYLQALFLAAAFTAIFSATSVGQALLRAAGNSQEQLKRINQVVLRGREMDLDGQEQIHAARVASVLPVSVPLQTYGFGYLFASTGTIFARQALVGQGGFFGILFLILLVIFVAVLVPRTMRQVRKARRYANKHAGLLAE